MLQRPLEAYGCEVSSMSTKAMHNPLGIIARCALALALCLAFVPLFPQHSMAATTWSMAKDGGSYVIVIVTEPYFGGSQWGYDDNATLSIQYDSGVVDNTAAIQIVPDGDASRAVDAWYGSISGSSVTASADGTQYTVVIPASFFADENFTVSYAGQTARGAGSASEPATQPEMPAEPDTPANPAVDPVIKSLAPVGTYSGIKIDGLFDDWDAVQKHEISDGKDWSTVDQVAMVWDGDYVYIYFMALGENGTGNWNSVTNAGPNSNGQFAITTDLGRTLPIQLSVDQSECPPKPIVAGVSGASAAVNNTDWFGAPHMWEVAIPTSALPAYDKTISFGFLLTDPTIKDVANLQTDDPKGGFDGIVYDGSYDDWAYYPHTVIEYATAGTQEHVVDAEGALYIDGKDLYAHAATNMPAHLQNGGTEFTQGVLIRFNESDDYMFSPRFGPVGPDGGPLYNADGTPVMYDEGQLHALMDGQKGSFEFCVFSLDAGHTHEGQLNDTNQCYGKMIVTLADAQSDMEWKLDLELIGKHLRSNANTPVTGLDVNDIKTVEVKWQRLGDKWVTTAGTSTGPLMLLAGCGTIAVAGAFMGMRRRRFDAPKGSAQPMN